MFKANKISELTCKEIRKSCKMNLLKLASESFVKMTLNEIIYVLNLEAIAASLHEVAPLQRVSWLVNPTIEATGPSME